MRWKWNIGFNIRNTSFFQRNLSTYPNRKENKSNHRWFIVRFQYLLKSSFLKNWFYMRRSNSSHSIFHLLCNGWVQMIINFSDSRWFVAPRRKRAEKEKISNLNLSVVNTNESPGSKNYQTAMRVSKISGYQKDTFLWHRHRKA